MIVSLRAILAVVVALLTLPAQAAERPRVASINACTDQLLLALADPEQIVGLSPYAHDAGQSPTAQQALRYPALSGGAEDALMLRPDVMVAGEYDRRTTRELLKQHGVRVAEFNVMPSTLPEVREQIRRMGEIVGHPGRAAAEIARIDAAAARAHRAVAARPLRVLPLWRRGWVSGNGSLVGLLFAEAGLTNAAADLGVASGGFVPMEAIVSARPDLILVSSGGAFAEDEGRAFLLHPALQRFYPPSKRIVIPERLTMCGSGLLADAFDLLVGELERIGRDNHG
jgi:iron complex transport system substrate-binding protein